MQELAWLHKLEPVGNVVIECVIFISKSIKVIVCSYFVAHECFACRSDTLMKQIQFVWTAEGGSGFEFG